MERDHFKLWGLKFFVLMLIAAPSFNNLYVLYFNKDIIEGLKQGHLYYFVAVSIFIVLVTGKETLYLGYCVTSLIALSVVFMGSLVSFLKLILKYAFSFPQAKIFEYSQHYLVLLVTLATMVPLAIATVSVIPFFRYEKRVMSKTQGISFAKKLLLIGSRVFAHIIYFVIPKILLVVREEEQKGHPYFQSSGFAQDIILERGKKTIKKCLEQLSDYYYIGLSGIRFAIEYIPLWALEISQLPSKKEKLSGGLLGKRKTG